MAERGSFVQDIVARGQLVPSSWKYFPYEKKKKVFGNSMYHLPYYKPKPKKNNIGPGSYHDTFDQAFETKVLKSVPFFQFSKSKRVDLNTQKALQKKFVPGVGTYPGANDYNSIAANVEKRKPIINKYKFKRFTEMAGESKEWVPGPGSYNLAKRPKVYNKEKKEN